MIQTIIIDQIGEQSNDLASKLKSHCPSLHIKAIAEKEEQYLELLKDPEIEMLFIDPAQIPMKESKNIKAYFGNKALICVSSSTQYACLASYWHSVGYLLKPVQITKLVEAVECAKNLLFSIREQIHNQNLLYDLKNKKVRENLLGIPTMEGFEIISVEDILRCEGLQKCTRIVTNKKDNIVSSYNIGVFKNLLSEFPRFFFPHRSFIINLQYVQKFKRSGSIIMKDGSAIPISKSKKTEFMNFIIPVKG